MTDHDDQSLELQVEVPGTPEEVWAAIATGPGIGAWFVPTEVDEREGGAAVFHLGGGMDAPATVTGWEPPGRFAYEEPWSDTTRLATEFLVEARAGGTCVVRLVTTFNDPGHGDELASMDGGWTGFLDNLRLYLTHFRGLPAVPVALMATVAETPGDALERALASIGAADAQAGDRVLDGVVERRGDDELLVRREASLLGFGAFAWDGETKVAVRETCYGPDAAAASAAATERWEAWIGATFGAAAVR